MKHFIGGYSVGFCVIFAWVMERGSYNRQKPDAAMSMIFAAIFATPFGLATWGLLP